MSAQVKRWRVIGVSNTSLVERREHDSSGLWLDIILVHAVGEILGER